MRYTILLLFASVLFSSCEKDLDFKYHEIESQLVIEGSITQNGSSISLTYTTPMGEPLSTSKVVDATIELSDLTDGTIRQLDVDDTGAYIDDVAGIIGHDYQIKVFHEGKSYQSSCTMRPPSQIISMVFQWIKMPYDDVAVLQILFTDNNSDDDCYWIRIYRNDEPYMWIVSDDRKSVNGVINEVVMTSRKDVDEEDEKTALRDGDIVSASVAPVSREMYDYLNAIQDDSNGPQMFSGDFCLGYFLAAPISESAVVFKPEEIKEFK